MQETSTQIQRTYKILFSTTFTISYYSNTLAALVRRNSTTNVNTDPRKHNMNL